MNKPHLSFLFLRKKIHSEKNSSAVKLVKSKVAAFIQGILT